MWMALLRTLLLNHAPTNLAPTTRQRAAGPVRPPLVAVAAAVCVVGWQLMLVDALLVSVVAVAVEAAGQEAAGSWKTVGPVLASEMKFVPPPAWRKLAGPC